MRENPSLQSCQVAHLENQQNTPKIWGKRGTLLQQLFFIYHTHSSPVAVPFEHSKFKINTLSLCVCVCHGSQSRSRPPTRRALRRIGLGDLDRSRAIRTKRYIESSKNSEKITTNLKKNVDIHIYVSHVQNISPSTLNIKRKHKYTRHQ